MSYADYEYYTKTYGGSIITADNASKMLRMASEAVDSLTYCRIVSHGLMGLSDYQRAIVQNVVCALADWQTENAEILTSPYSSYSINGVSATWGTGTGVKKINGVFIPSYLYAELVKSGLCYAGV
jgi:hypothetical protein